MAARGIIHQYYILLTCLQRGHYPSINELTEQLAEAGFAPSKRTLERYLEQLRDEFGLECSYDPRQKGYALVSSDARKAQNVRAFLERLLIGELLTQEVTERTDALNYLAFDTDAAYSGLPILEQLLFALRHQRIIAFDHTSYQRTEPKRYNRFRPYFLKEYQNRWYVVGQAIDEIFPRILGTDRLSQLLVLNDTFELPADAPTPATFAHLIGVAEFYKASEKVRLAVAASQLPYLKSLPWHSSQQIIEETETEFMLELTITPNYELVQRILAQGANVRVLEPNWLREQIGSELRKAAELYK